MTEVTGWLHLIAAILASWRLTELIVMDRISGPFRQRYPWYIWTCPRCVSVWAGIACTAAWVYLPWANWPLALAWLYLIRMDIAATWPAWRQRQREWTNTYERKPISGGATITAASCENKPGQLDVQSAIDSAVNGDTVIVPAGSCTWETAVVNTNARYLTIQGAGIGTTVITDAIPADPGNGRMLDWVSVTGGLTRITGFTFQGGTVVDSDQQGMVVITGNSDQVRFDHNRVNDTRRQPFKINGYVRGVADHNIFNRDEQVGTNNGVTVDHNTWGNSGSFGDNSWATAETFGSSEAFYFEDNTWTSTNPPSIDFGTDGQAGGRAVFRFNTFLNNNIGFHGGDSGGRLRSFRQLESYNNAVTYDKNGAGDEIPMHRTRGGVAMVWDNTLTLLNGTTADVYAPSVFRHTESQAGSWGGWCKSISVTSLTQTGGVATLTGAQDLGVSATTFAIQVQGANEADYNGVFVPISSGPASATTLTYAVPAGTPSPATGTIAIVSPFDNNQDDFGYPCLDQTGRGAGDTMVGNPPTTYWPNQVLVGTYVWNNTKDGVLTDASVSGALAEVVVQGRDLHDSVVGGGAGNGTARIGRGTLAQRPSTCTAPSVGNTAIGYFATDQGTWNRATELGITPGGTGYTGQGVLYRCTATDTWTTYYTPYTYPHPGVVGPALSHVRLRP